MGAWPVLVICSFPAQKSYENQGLDSKTIFTIYQRILYFQCFYSLKTFRLQKQACDISACNTSFCLQQYNSVASVDNCKCECSCVVFASLNFLISIVFRRTQIYIYSPLSNYQRWLRRSKVQSSNIIEPQTFSLILLELACIQKLQVNNGNSLQYGIFTLSVPNLILMELKHKT